MSLKDTTTLTAHALAAYRVQLEDESKRVTARFAERAEAARKTFVKMFGFHGKVTHGADDAVLVTSGDLTLRAIYNDKSSNKTSYFQLDGTCWECGASCYSRGIHGLEDLGKQIKEFVPWQGHKCPPAIHYPTAGEALLEAFQNYIDSIIEEVG